MNKEFLELVSDTTFKYLFKSDNGRKYLDKVIQYITGINIEKYKLVDNELNSGNKYKDYRTDILLFNKEESIIINVEMNREKNDTYVYRNYAYVSKIIGEMFNKGDIVREYKVIQLNFNNFYNKYDNNINTLSFMLRDKLTDIELDFVKVIEIYIPTYKNICYNGKNEEIMFISMFSAKNYEELKNIVRDNKEGLSIMDEIELLAEQEEIIGLYNFEREQKRIGATMKAEGYEEGKAEGREEGKNETTKEIVLNSLNNGLDKMLISKLTGLSLSKIEEISRNAQS